jgi:ATP-dependent DNA ligase
VDGHRLIVPARRLAGDGLKAWQEVLERGYEGLVAKNPRRPMLAGGRWRGSR